MSEYTAGPDAPRPSWQRGFVDDHGHGDWSPAPSEPEVGVSRLPPYMLTAGRAQPVDSTLEIEAQVVTSDLGARSYARLAFEHRDILTLCDTTMSVAEVGARLNLHIGVARVLVADLAAMGYLVVHRPSSKISQDLSMIERVIRGLEAIH